MRTERKLIKIPCCDITSVDYTDVIDIVQTPQFQALRGRKQLANAALVFPGAQHTRFEHSIGSYHGAKGQLYRLMRQGMLPQHLQLPLQVYALLHDVGHGPGSHALEAVATRSHKQNGIRIIQELAGIIEKTVHVPVSLLIDMFEKKHPAATLVSDYNLGGEKIDYLRRDAYHCGFQVLNADHLIRHIMYVDGVLGISSEVMAEAKRLLTDYAFMYENVYLKLRCLRFGRMFAKMVAALLRDGVPEDDIWRMTDGELEGVLWMSKNPEVQFLYPRYRKAEKPHTVVVLRPEGTERFELEHELKHVTVVDPALFALAHHNSHTLMLEIEQRTAKCLGIQPEMVVAIPPLEKSRFEPRDIPVFHHGRRLSLMEQDPHAFTAIRATYDRYAGLRVCVFKEHLDAAWAKRETLASIATDVLKNTAKLA